MKSLTRKFHPRTQVSHLWMVLVGDEAREELISTSGLIDSDEVRMVLKLDPSTPLLIGYLGLSSGAR